MIELRHFTPNDTLEFYRISHSADDIKMYVPGIVKNTIQDTEDFVAAWAVADFECEYAFVIEHVNGPKRMLIGAIWADLDDVYNGLFISYFLGKDFRGRGYMKTALNLFIEYCRKNTPFDCLIFDIELSNKSSRELVLSLGGRKLAGSSISCWDDFQTFIIDI